MEFFNSAIEVLQTLVVALGAGLGVWGAINLLEGYGNDLFRGNRYQSEPQYYCNKRCRSYIWLCILPVHRFRKRLCHSG